MSSLMNSLGIDQLTPGDQLRLVGEILETLAERPDPTLSQAQKKELDRRLAVLDAGETTVTPWAEAEARVLGRLGG